METSGSFYLGPRRSRLVASTWDDIVAAAAAGLLDETHWVELKQAVPASSKPANLELARDLASLSVEGGVLLIGIVDANGSAGAVTGTDVAGLESRIAQVAAGTISPPLSVTLDIFGNPNECEAAVIVVTVPASAGAPHMVDGHYWGRGATGKRKLEDDEVRRLFADRQSRSAGFSDRLLALPGRLDPGEAGAREQSRMYVLLEPAAAAEVPMSETLRGNQVLQVAVAAIRFTPQWGPSLDSVNYSVPHPDGLAGCSVAPGQDVAADERFLYLLLADDGSVHLSAPASRLYGAEDDAPEVLSPGQLLETLHSCIVLAGHLAAEHTGYTGAWQAGIYLDHLRGRLPSQAYSTMSLRNFSPYQANSYVRDTETTSQELTQAPAAVVERLANGLLRGLGVADRFLPYTDPAEIAQRSR